MKRQLYSLIPLLIITGPLALSFDQKVHFSSHWGSVLLATLVIGSLFVVWDIIVFKRGDWQFNDAYVGTRRILGLPIGEILFFIAVPYACLFLFEVGRSYFGSTSLAIWPIWLSWFLAAVAIAGAIYWRKQGYTQLALLALAVFWIAQAVCFPFLILRYDFLFFSVTGLVAFGIVNGSYTALPTIFYRPEAIWGRRFFKIPLEDFMYNWAYLGLTLIVYLAAEGRP